MTGWPAILDGSSRGPLPAALRAAAALAEPAYRAAVARRNRAFDTGQRPAIDLGRPTLSVGNLTAGGTGKTPVTRDLVARLRDRGHRPAVLTRGYHGGDEADELAHALGPDVPLGVGPSRVDSAQRVLADHPDASCFVLDDAFQHRQAKRDVDLVLIDATAPFGPTAIDPPRLIPRGLLREPPESLARADAVLVTRAEQADPDTRAALDARVIAHHGNPPIAHASMTWAALDGSAPDADPADRSFDRDIAVDRLAMLDVVAVTGIGNPDAFDATLHAHAARVIAHHRFPDHHRYAALLLGRLLKDARQAGAHAVITTAKDFAKWLPILRESPHLLPDCLPIFRPRLAIDYDRPDAVDHLLDRLGPPPTTA
ncbi:MAG: tetraacyldisaccharide 4'-kinase [Planctomycetota bacterium]